MEDFDDCGNDRQDLVNYENRDYRNRDGGDVYRKRDRNDVRGIQDKPENGGMFEQRGSRRREDDTSGNIRRRNDGRYDHWRSNRVYFRHSFKEKDGASSHGTEDGYRDGPSLESRTVMIRGLTQSSDENSLRDLVSQFQPASVRWITDRGTGKSRGFAFVDFHTLDLARTFYRTFAGSQPPLMLDGAKLWLEYSRSSAGSGGGVRNGTPPPPNRGRMDGDWRHDRTEAKIETLPPRAAGGGGGLESRAPRPDWICGEKRCGTINFARRDQCFKCSTPRGPGSRVVPSSAFHGGGGEVGGEDAISVVVTHPTRVLLVRGLGFSTNEHEVQEAFRPYAPVVRCVVVRDRSRNNASRGFGFVEFASLEHAQHTFDSVRGHEGASQPPSPFIIDGNTTARVFYALESYATRLDMLMGVSVQQQQQQQHHGHSALIQNQVQPHILTCLGVGAGADGVSGVPVLLPGGVLLGGEAATTVVRAEAGGGWPPPFEQSGAAYVYDTASHLYFEPGSGFYYNATTQQYYDGHNRNFYVYAPGRRPPFLPFPPLAPVTGVVAGSPANAPPAGTAQAAAADAKTSDCSVPKKSNPRTTSGVVSFGLRKPPLVSYRTSTSSSKRSKDISIWGHRQKTPKAPMVVGDTTVSSEALIVATSTEAERATVATAAVAAAATAASSAAVPVGLTSEEVSVHEPAVSAAVAGVPVCLLCRRRFASQEQLLKHINMSKLHKKNLEDVQAKAAAVAALAAAPPTHPKQPVVKDDVLSAVFGDLGGDEEEDEVAVHARERGEEAEAIQLRLRAMQAEQEMMMEVSRSAEGRGLDRERGREWEFEKRHMSSSRSRSRGGRIETGRSRSRDRDRDRYRGRYRERDRDRGEHNMDRDSQGKIKCRSRSREGSQDHQHKPNWGAPSGEADDRGRWGVSDKREGGRGVKRGGGMGENQGGGVQDGVRRERA